MKKLIASIAITALLAVAASAQTFSAGVTVTGTTNAPVQVNFAPLVYTAYGTIPPKGCITSVTNAVNTNLLEILSYGFTVSGNSNPVVVTSITNTLPASGSITNSIPSYSASVSVIPWAQVSVGTNIVQINFQ